MGYLSTGDIASTGQALLNVTGDPHLPEIICHAVRLGKMEKHEDPGLKCDKIPFGTLPGKGIGLRYLVFPVRLADKMREKPYIAIATTAGLIFSIFALGFIAGKAGK